MHDTQATVYLGLGANLGDRESNLVEALNRLRPSVEVLHVSRTYETNPVGVLDQPKFLNIACAARTRLSPIELLEFLKRIERHMGRIEENGVRYGPRPIDIDILLYADKVLDTEQLVIPHPLLHERAFALIPLSDVASELVHPRLGQTIRELCAAVDSSGVAAKPHGLLSGYHRDVQSETPQVTLGLDRVGLTDVRRLVRLTSRGRPEYLPATMNLAIDLAGDCKGAHMSRFSIAVEEALNETLQQTAPNIETLSLDIARELLKAQGAMRAEVTVQAEFPLSRRTPVSGLLSQEIYTLTGIAAATEGREVQLLGVAADGMTACPCAQELVRDRARTRLREENFDDQEITRILQAVPTATHNQSGRGELLMTAAPSIRAEELVHIVEASMSSEIYEILKRPDEYFVVNRAHRNPKFVEDVVRGMLAYVAEIYAELPDDTFVRARQTNMETIHKHNVFAERCALLGDVRAQLGGKQIRSPQMTLNTWINSRLSPE